MTSHHNRFQPMALPELNLGVRMRYKSTFGFLLLKSRTCQ